MTVLSIGMIVKNEEKRLRRTLEALQPLRDGVDCQLIIADTGSDDGTIEIAQEFADTFLQIPWENDFAKARNATLAKAQGEWYFYLDADEVLAEVEELVEFFNHPRKRQKYHGLVIRLHSLLSTKQDKWQDFASDRLFRIAPGQWFEGVIHEHYPRQQPVYELKTAHLLHYGYDNDEVEYMQKKGERNLAIMDKQMQAADLPQDKDGAKLWTDYAESLMLVAGRTEDAREAAQKAIDLLLPYDGNDMIRAVMLARAYAVLLRTFARQNDYQACIERTQEYFDKQPQRNLWDLDIYYMRGGSCLSLKRFQDAISAYKSYLQISAVKRPQELARLILFSYEGMENQARYFLSKAYANLSDYTAAWTYAQQITSANVEGADINAYKWNLALEYDSIHRIPELYAALSTENRENILRSLPDAICKKDSRRQREIAAGFQKIVSDDEAALLPIWALAINDATEMVDCLRRMETIYFNTAQGGIIRQCLKQQIPMRELLPHLEKNKIHDYIVICQAYYNDWLNWTATYYDAYEPEDLTLPELWLAKQLLCAGMNDQNADVLLVKTIVSIAIRYIPHYLTQVYQPIILDTHVDLLSLEEQFILYAAQAEEAIAQKDYARAVKALHEGVTIFPAAQAVVSIKLAEIEELADPIGAEMKRLAATVKQQIRSLINDGSLDEAETLIDELSAIVPDDPDIPYLLEQTQPPDIIWN